jgi:crossover junction endodeoxyribonuclease RusA
MTAGFHYECSVPGIPASLQTRNKSSLKAWKAKVAHHALQTWPVTAAPITGPLSLQVVYYYEQPPLDTDNMIKPICDALIGIVYEDDNQVSDIRAAKRDLNGLFRVRGMSAELARGFSYGSAFVHITASEPPDPQELVS